MTQAANGQLVDRDVGEPSRANSFIVAGERLCPLRAPRRAGRSCSCGIDRRPSLA
jgi:hypothetical protein